MIDTLIKVLIGMAVGAAGVGAVGGVYVILSKSNLAEKTKSAFFKKRAAYQNNESAEAMFTARVKEKEKNSVSSDEFFVSDETPITATVKKINKKSVIVEVIFNVNGETMTEEVSIPADKISDDIIEGETIILDD